MTAAVGKAMRLKRVIDPKGVIRAKGVRGEQMDKAVDSLLEELAGKRK